MVWQADDLNEELFDLALSVHELFHVNGFGDVGVGIKLVLRRMSSRADEVYSTTNGDVCQVGVSPQGLQQLTSVVLREIEVEQNQIGTACFAVGAAAVPKI